MTGTGNAAAAAMRGTAELAGLAAEQRDFADLLASLGAADWARPSAAAGWSVRDQVAHLADTEEVAADTLTGGPRAFAEAVSPHASAEDFTAAGCRRGDGMTPAELAGWWHPAAGRTRGLLAGLAAEDRVAWGFGMPARTFATARLMEHWAHGLDVRDALGLPVAETARLHHVAALGLATLRWALARGRVRWPAGRSLRLDLAAADGTRHAFGDADATDVLRGPLLAWCRVATRRTRGGPPPELRPEGELAELALLHARAYL
ncbi:maleylpyruvate isomerase family mycothiol-dependent enzyme [Streptomyces johnsoniae]|uniref:Maleylpyruvate isomerase family mycothiol-dependent enzyme n=1 Tax=Streptomyces johnsoniae TaxID=3075532 RepID=A0ABU2S375_9ACTN|nr:maleylpyruvate isomerase family mycothiol-dependent enzyme [Streptomyces sp. DSM 41886]MDT0442535.1 maleylpyruvate isomerase family mycothiol-dependent enzyme [Streptomyces sp. DSM 41886]